jgi:CheY-like chemotaxis protein
MNARVRRRPRSSASAAEHPEAAKDLSHDVRTSLNTVLGMTDLLGDTSLSADQRRFVAAVQRAGARLQTLVEQWLGASGSVGDGAIVPRPPFSKRRKTSGRALDGLRVLLADDSADGASLAKAQLESLGAVVCAVSNGAAALERLERERFDLAVIDIHLPKMDGFEVVRRARRAVEGAGGLVPIVGLTADVRAEVRARAVAVGFSSFLTKPIDTDALASALVRYRPLPAGSIPSSRVVTSLLPRFVARREKDPAAIREAIARRDFAAIATIGHDLRGNGRSYGFPELSLIGEKLEAAARARSLRRIEDTLRSLESRVATLRLEIGAAPANAPSRARLRIAPTRKGKDEA